MIILKSTTIITKVQNVANNDRNKENESNLGN